MNKAAPNPVMVVVIEHAACPFCLEQGCATLRPTKNLRPTFRCEACGTRAFIYTEKAAKNFQWVMSGGVQYSAAAAAAIQQPVAVPQQQVPPQSRATA